MSKESRRRWRELRQQTEQAATVPAPRRSRHWHWLAFAGAVALLVAGVAAWRWKAPQPKTPATVVPSQTPTPAEARLPGAYPPKSYSELGALSPEDMAKCDIALMNLLCAEGLRGSEKLDVASCLATLDRFAAHARVETERNLHRYRERPFEFNYHEGNYRMAMLATVFQQDFAIRYNPARITQPGREIQSNEEFFADSRDIFIHGLAKQGGTGTCSSLPVFYVAVGRRLGYPLKLVKAKGHLFVRWSDGERSFNIEATSVGFNSHPDSYYREWPFPFTPREEQEEGYLKDMTPMQELSVFYSARGACLEVAGDLKKALGAFAYAYYKEPQAFGNEWLFARARHIAALAGALPRRDCLLILASELVLPPPTEPRFAYFASSLAMLKAKLARDDSDPASELDLETDFMALRAELHRYQPPDPFLRAPRPKQPQIHLPPPILLPASQP